MAVVLAFSVLYCKHFYFSIDKNIGKHFKLVRTVEHNNKIGHKL